MGRYAGGIPDPEQHGIALNMLKPSPDFTAASEAAAHALQRPRFYVDEDGYDRDIIAAVVEPENTRLAWVEYRARERGSYVDVAFHLRAMVAGDIVIEWEVETYNPYFGCRVQHLAWYGERLVVIYDEKHDTFAGALGAGLPVARVEIGDEWWIEDALLCHRERETAPVARLHLPGLEPVVAETSPGEPPAPAGLRALLRRIRARK